MPIDVVVEGLDEAFERLRSRLVRGAEAAVYEGGIRAARRLQAELIPLWAGLSWPVRTGRLVDSLTVVITITGTTSFDIDVRHVFYARFQRGFERNLETFRAQSGPVVSRVLREEVRRALSQI